MPTPLVEAVVRIKQMHETSRDAARAGLASGQADLAAVTELLAELTRELAARERGIAERTARLPEAPTPADQEALVGQIAGLRAEARNLQARIQDATDEAEHARAVIDVSTATLRRSSEALRTAEENARAVIREKEERDAREARLGSTPLNDLPAAAGAALASSLFTAARTRIQTDLPEKLLASARVGYRLEAARMELRRSATQEAEDRLSDAWEENDGGAGTVRRLRLEAARAERDVRNWVDRAAERYARALSLLAAVSPTEPLITPEASQRLQDLEDDGGAAAELRLERDEKQLAVDTARAELELQRLIALLPDPHADPADIAEVAEVKQAQEDLDAAFEALEDARNAYDADQQAAFGAWAAAVPDAAWRKLLGFLDAEATLGEIESADPEALVLARDAAEEALAESLEESAEGLLTTGFATDEVALRAERLNDARGTLHARLLSAVRGDA